MFDRIKPKHIFFLPILITVLSALILYGFFYNNFLDIYRAGDNFLQTRKIIIPDGLAVNFKYLVLFSGLILMSFTDMLFERIAVVIPAFLILAGFLFAFRSGLPLTSVAESVGVGLGIFILIDIMRFGSYAMGDILTAGAIGSYVGIENIVIISILAIILGRAVTMIAARFDGICDKSPVKSFHMAFVPFLFLAAAILYNVINYINIKLRVN
ncbi:MAG: prepilin peptidase [bacterium]